LSDHRSIPRRGFLVASGSLLSGLWRFVAPLSFVASAAAPAAERKVLTTAQEAVLLRVARTIAPHDTLPDAAYAFVVQAIDAAAADPKVRATVETGLERLGRDFATRDEAERVRALQSIEQSEAFQFFRSTTLGALYSSPIAYAHFGYEGEAFSKGGYLVRGFNDLKWLPEVPMEDSGPTLP